MQREVAYPVQSREIPGLQLKRALFLTSGDLRAKVEPDGSLGWVQSGASKSLLFGRSVADVFKIQSGVKINARPQEYLVRISPKVASFTSRGQERLLLSHSVSVVRGDCPGYLRRTRLSNRGDAVCKVRFLMLHDPTSLNYRRERDPPGEIGVNAFNRHDQVVMDDVGDTTGVRVIAFSPRPSAVYMTNDKARANELMALGELPESSIGMSGSIMVLTQHDFEVQPGASVEASTLSVYHPSSLEIALKSASQHPPRDEDDDDALRFPHFACSNQSVTFAYGWAKAALNSIESEHNTCEKLWCGPALAIMRQDYLERMLESIKRTTRKRDGLLPHSDGREAASPTETALFIIALVAHLNLRADKKKALRAWYPVLKRVATALCATAENGLIASSEDVPEGWRRRLSSGFPTGCTSEVNLIAASALRDASTISYALGKGSDSAALREISVRLINALNEKLRDPESGMLALNVDARGVVHKEMAVDQAVGLSYFSPDPNLASSVVHRLLEKDFETGYGPRSIPNSNALYFNVTYSDGQLGGYWTRASLSHALLAYVSGYPSIGSLQLEKVARLVHTEAEKLGGVPGEFPYWLDPDRRQILSSGSDPVAAARFIETLMRGEMGLWVASGLRKVKVSEVSQLKWFEFHALDLGKPGSIFVGRFSGKVFVATTLDAEIEGGARFPHCARLDATSGQESLLFWDDSTQVLCVGNGGHGTFSGTLSVPVKVRSLTSSLFANVEELDQSNGLWAPLEKVKVLGQLSMRLDVKPGAWRALRISPVS